MDDKIIVRPKEDSVSTFSVRVPTDLLDGLEEICKQTGHSRNHLIRIAIEHFLENVEVKKDQSK